MFSRNTQGLANNGLIRKPTTLVLDGPRNVAHNLIAPDKTLGIRIVKFFVSNYWREKNPLVSTSANISGQPTPKF
jgi:L-threonylcarbamoyladenylate synthase